MMGTKVLSSKNILYFCNVKNLTRHVVAAESSVFRAYNFKEKSYPNDGGSSNAHKGSALDTLTHRIGVFICQKFNVMNNEKEKTQQDTLLLEAAKNIQQHLNDFSNVSELWKTCARAGAAIAHCQSKVAEGELDDVADMLNEYICILDLLKPFEDANKR